MPECPAASSYTPPLLCLFRTGLPAAFQQLLHVTELVGRLLQRGIFLQRLPP